MKDIILQGVRTHNLKNITVRIPRNQLVVLTGLSGSGKSSLAFDTIYAEGQRRYVESLSTYARQFLSVMPKPDVDVIEGLSPAIAIEQKASAHNPRSTVGTMTEIYDYLRLLYARVGTPRCPVHQHFLEKQTISQMVDGALSKPEGSAWMILVPLVQFRKGDHKPLFKRLQAHGFVRVRVDGELFTLDELPDLNARRKHTIELVVDRFKVRAEHQQRLAESFETALVWSPHGVVIVAAVEGEESHVFSARFACPECGFSIEKLEPSLFSFNNPAGACPQCDGLGVEQIMAPDLVVAHRELSVAQGAIRGWDRRYAYYHRLLESVATHYGFDLERPFESLSEKWQSLILYGSGTETLPLVYTAPRGREVVKQQVFEGVIPNMQRRYRESQSDAIREELAGYLAIRPCQGCDGARLNEQARTVWVGEARLPELTSQPLKDVAVFFEQLAFEGAQQVIAEKIVKELKTRLQFLLDVGLGYLSLDRRADSLSGGESQRIRLASQIGSGLVGVMYILDEPSIGLHPRDHERLLVTLRHLRDLGNTVIVVEHDRDTILQADYVFDIGPGAGVHGGVIVAEGTPEEVMKTAGSLTGEYLSQQREIPLPERRLSSTCRSWLTLSGLTKHNLQAVDVSIPVGLMTCLTGVSGSGKSTVMNETIAPLMRDYLNKRTQDLAAYHVESVSGRDHFKSMIVIDQSPIGRTPRSNPATYTGILTPIRELFAGVPEARARGYRLGRFSFNVRGGRCEACEGEGYVKVEMHFLPDVYVECDACHGKRYNRETLDIRYKGANIADVLAMTVEEAYSFFDAVPVLKRRLQTLIDVGLGYICLGQSAMTLSGGEAQRIKLSRELSKRDTGETLYLLDEPTTGLHFHDVAQLLSVLHILRDRGNTILLIEHHLDVVKVADWLIDLGPDGGDGGGEVVVSGSPEHVAACSASLTGQFLKSVLPQKAAKTKRKKTDDG